MKWIGQHIWSFISRFRDNIYVENSTINVTNGADDDEYFQIKTLSQGNTALTTVGDSTSNITIKPASHKLSLGDTHGNNFTVENQAHDNGAGSSLFIKAGSATAGQTNQNGGGMRFYSGAPTGSGTFGDFSFYGGDVEGSGTSLRTTSLVAQIKSEAATSTDLYLYEKAGSSITDFLKISVAEHGATTITTTDAGGTSANLQITADGTAELAGTTVTLDSAGAVSLDGTTTDFIVGGTTVGQATARGYVGDIKIENTSGNTAGDHQGDVVYFGGTTSMTTGAIYHYNAADGWELADADDNTKSDGLLGVALGAASNTNGVLLRGFVTIDHDPGAVGDVLYLSTTAGDCTATAPSSSGNIIRVIGYQVIHASNGNIWFNPSSTFVEHA